MRKALVWLQISLALLASFSPAVNAQREPITRRVPFGLPLYYVHSIPAKLSFDQGKQERLGYVQVSSFHPWGGLVIGGCAFLLSRLAQLPALPILAPLTPAEVGAITFFATTTLGTRLLVALSPQNVGILRDVAFDFKPTTLLPSYSIRFASEAKGFQVAEHLRKLPSLFARQNRMEVSTWFELDSNNICQQAFVFAEGESFDLLQ